MSDGKLAPVLQKAYSKIWPQADCVQKKSHISDKKLCWGEEATRVSECNGDNGSPLACLIEDRWYQYGIASFNDRTDSAEQDNDASCKKSGFVRLTKFTRWIWKTIDDYEKKIEQEGEPEYEL